MALTGKQKQHLRALAHHLEPVVHIGKGGITESLLTQVDDALRAHELIKVKITGECPVTRDEAAEAIAASAKAEIAQTIGNVIVAFRRRPQEKAKVPLPTAKGKLAAAKRSKEASKGRRPGRKKKEKKRIGKRAYENR